MTEQFMDDLSNEEHEALLLMCGHAVGPPLSPAAKAVLDAFRAVPDLRDCPSIAAVLRTAADQVVPEEPLYGGDQRWEWERDARQSSRKKMLAIAAELEAQQ